MATTVRAEQLRSAKRRQRERDRVHGLELYQIKLPARLIQKLRAGMQDDIFVANLSRFIDAEQITVKEYRTLDLLCWNRNKPFITKSEAFQIYERNWRHVDESNLDQHELALLRTLKADFGRGVINA